MNLLPALRTILDELRQRFGAQIEHAHAPQPNELYLHTRLELAGALCSAFYKRYNGRLAGVFAEDARAGNNVFFVYYLYALDSAWMNGRSLPVVFHLLELCQLLLPFGGSVSAARFVEELHQTMKGFFDPDLALTRNFFLPLLHALVAGQQQRFGFSIFLLCCQTAAQQALRIEWEPIVGKLFLANIQALAKQRLGFGELILVAEQMAQ